MPRSNQETLGSGCVCETGCKSCDRLAEAWEAMTEALDYAAVHSSSGQIRDKARAALALARKVSRSGGES